MKRIFLFVIALTLAFQISANAQNSSSWYFKRNGNLQPILDESQEIIYKYNGFYLDRAHGDDSDDKVLYLTFDVGYENGNVEKILDALKAENVSAAFFVLSNFVYKNTDLIFRMIDENHLVCNHTSKHLNIAEASSEKSVESIKRLEEVFKEKTGEQIAPFFRFPEGKYNEESLKLVDELGYKSVFWSLAYADWDDCKQQSAEKAMKLLLDNTHNGAIVLLHPTSSTNAEILPQLLKAWKNMGYRFGTLSEI